MNKKENEKKDEQKKMVITTRTLVNGYELIVDNEGYMYFNIQSLLFKGLNGDILIWYPVLGRSIELSSMGIRVDKEALLRQLELENKMERLNLFFHKKLMNDEIPLSVGGGIGQSRLCMVLLHKAHVGEIQASIWPEEMRRECAAAGMPLI